MLQAGTSVRMCVHVCSCVQHHLVWQLAALILYQCFSCSRHAGSGRPHVNAQLQLPP